MDGLTISNAKKFVESGRTFTDLSAQEMKGAGGSSGGKSFAQTLSEAVNEVNQLQKTADVKMQKLATGESQNIADVMIATEKADIALRLMVQVRNKVINAYNEIMKMQV